MRVGPRRIIWYKPGCSGSQHTKTTLKDQLSGQVWHSVKPGPKPCLDNSKETELASFIKECAPMGYGKTHRDVMSIVQSTAESKGPLRTKERGEKTTRRKKEEKAKKAKEKPEKAKQKSSE